MVKTDQEPSIQYLGKDMIEKRASCETVPEESPAKSSGSNSVAGRGVSEIEGEIRSRMGRLWRCTQERIVSFTPAYIAYMTNCLS